MTKRSLWTLFQWAIAAVVLWLLVGYVRRYWDDFAALEIRFSWLWAGLGLLFVLLSDLIQIALLQYFLRHNGLSINFLSAWRVYSLPQVGKYVPGKVTAVAALSYMLKEAGLSLPHALAAVFVFNIVAQLSGLVVGLIMLPIWAPHASRMTIVFCMGAALVTAPVVCTRGFWRLVNHGLARFKRPPLPSYPSRTAMTRLMLGWILYWFVVGSGMFSATRLFTDVPLSLFPLLLASFSLSCFISNVSLLTPAGLGVREALLISMIGSSSTTAFGTIFAATSRLAMVLNDVVMIGGAWLLTRRQESFCSSGIKSIRTDSLGEKEEWPGI